MMLHKFCARPPLEVTLVQWIQPWFKGSGFSGSCKDDQWWYEQEMGVPGKRAGAGTSTDAVTVNSNGEWTTEEELIEQVPQLPPGLLFPVCSVGWPVEEREKHSWGITSIRHTGSISVVYYFIVIIIVMQVNGLKTFEQERICKLVVNVAPHLAILRATHRVKHYLQFLIHAFRICMHIQK